MNHNTPVPSPREKRFLAALQASHKMIVIIVGILGGIILLAMVGFLCFFAGKYFSEPESAAISTAPVLPEPEEATVISQTEPTFTEQTEPSEPTVAAIAQTEPIEATEATQAAVFEPYLVTVYAQYYDLPIYYSPDFRSSVVDYITKTGTYTIVDEETVVLSNGSVTLWGKLKTGIGWINLIDAKGEYPPPLNCQDCGKSHQETAISRYGYCDPCHEKNGVADYGTCEKCGRSIESVAATMYNGRRCFNCHSCDYCGSEIEIWEYDKAEEYMCGDCYRDIYLMVGSCYYCGAVCDVLTGACEDCVNASLPCKICGFACAPYDADGICEDCYGKDCDYCGGPLSEDHNCDDYPNVICPNCGWGIHTTGVGTEGWDCPECGTNIIPGVNEES